MWRLRRRDLHLWVTVILSALGLLGCGGTETRFVPEDQVARDSITAALDAWKSGAAPGPVTTLETPVELVDARRSAGRRLESYELLEEVAETPHRTFKVRMMLVGAKAPEELEYYVLGINPILVYRDKDYGQTAGM
jgi:hypothetical protein